MSNQKNLIVEEKRDNQLQQIAESSKESIVFLKGKILGLTIQVGSGFFVQPDKIVTNIHVIEQAQKVIAINAKQIEIKRVPIHYRISDVVKNTIMQLFRGFLKHIKVGKNRNPNQSRIDRETAVYTVEGVTAFDDRNDLVLLKIAEKGVPLPIGNSDDLQNGESVYIVGYDGTKYKSIEGNIVSGHNSDKQLLIKAKVSPENSEGHSGGPVLNSRGEVIGVVSAGGEMSSEDGADAHSSVFAIPLTVLKALMANSEQVEPLRKWQKRPQIRAYTKEAIGNMILEAGKHKKAIAYYDAALQQNPNLTDVYWNRGNAKDNLGDFEGAIEDYDNAIRLDPEHSVAYYSRGIAKDNLDDFLGAIEDYDNAIRLNPEDANFYYNRGFAKSKLGDFEGAIEDCDNVIRLSPENAIAYHSRGSAKDDFGDFLGAIEDYNHAILLNPKYVEAYNNRGIAKNNLGDFSGAIDDYDMAIKLNPKHPNAYSNRGIVKDNLDDFAGAMDDYDIAIKLNPKYVEAYNNRGVAKDNLDDLVGAMDDYDMAIKLNPKYPNAYNNRGVAKKVLGKHEEAEADFAKAKELNLNKK